MGYVGSKGSNQAQKVFSVPQCPAEKIRQAVEAALVLDKKVREVDFVKRKAPARSYRITKHSIEAIIKYYSRPDSLK